MTIRTLPAAPAERPRASASSDLLPIALERWNPDIRAAADDENTISMFDPIGYDYWTGDGVTAKRVSAVLRNLAGADVTVNINSPGGDMFEGLAIYNILREYKGKVTVKILGLAASAASVIAMAGDEVRMGLGAFLMIHNCWVGVAGNRIGLREMADTLEPFDKAMANIYAARTGDEVAAMQTLMDAESWISGGDAVDQGFADSLLDSAELKEGTKASTPQQIAARRLDVILAKQGMPRSERRAMIQELKTGTPSAAGPGTPSATESPAVSASVIADFERALASFKSAASTVPGV
ncbi:head maturation protease, ClpP-related [Pseudomonas sp. CFBP 8772]|uniref:head maturation protease, ClpP-related n=1 Tax=Pseudomonas sp. CFBP 8772 TaxID=2775284 RepID=UPI00178390E3|nr:head maturation protease, ClpP-related [Pseudomonas sp. CFBP 8772]MBD8598750.1 Clp protease ClpP [Pseudomonas sp. CFBP 8772]